MAMRITQSLPAGRRHMRSEHGDRLRAWVPPRLTPIVAPVLGLLPQLSRYTLVSALALVLDFAVYLLLATGGMTVALAGAIGYACGLALHYILSVRYVFDAAAAHKAQSRLFAEFAISGLAGMVITALVIAIAVDVGGMPLLPAKILAVGMSFVVVFALRRGVVFASR
ncbi:MAG: GtrA family protein [Hyphomicrobiaceae bacterium]